VRGQDLGPRDHAVGSRSIAPGGCVKVSTPEADNTFVKICYFVTVLIMTLRIDICIHCLQVFSMELKNKSSAVADMGDYLATVDVGRNVGAARLFL